MALGNIHSDSDGQRGVDGCTETGEEIKKKRNKREKRSRER